MKEDPHRQQTSSAAGRTWSARRLLRNAVVLGALILFYSANPCSAAEWRAFWVDTWGAGILNQSQVDTLLGVPGTSTAGQIRDANCNAVFIEVRRNCDACYPSSMGEPYMSGLSPANFNALQACINAAHDTTGGKKRIEVHCWIVTFRTSGGLVYSQHSDTPTGSLTTLDNYWPSRDDTGAEVSDAAFDPGHPLALQYTVNVALDLVNNFDIDGIHYDYIRFTANNQGYNPTSIARYNARYGLTGQPAASNEQFKQWRRDQVTAVVRQVYARVQKSKPWVKQSGSFVTWNPSPTASTRAAFMNTRPYYDVYSDWDSWIQEGIVDMAVPMTYYDWASLPTDYTKWMDFEKDRKGNRHMIIGPGIYLNYLNDAILELQMTRDASPAGNYADGFCGYSYRSPYSTAKSPTRTYGTWADFAPLLVANVTPTWADIPDMPWKTSPATGHMMGTVTIAGTGAWADFATVNVSGPTNHSMMVDGTGFYAFIDLPPGSYTVTASRSGYPNATATVDVALGEVTGNMYQQDFVLGANTPPSITAQPQDQSISQGADAAFGVTATGTAPLSYQWRLYATNIAGATASSYTRNNVQPADAGPYSVVVTNIAGSVTSSNAILTVETNINPPAIVSQPLGQTVIAGQSATFTVTASGTGPLSYQWRFNTAPIAGATSSTYTRSNVQTTDAGSYSVVITNTAGSTNSADAVLAVHFSLTATATAGGTVSKNPDQASYAPNAVVTLTATPSDTNFLFTGWSGDADGTNNPLPVTMTANKTISATFVSIETDIILDNTNAAVSFVSAWQTGTSSTDKYGPDYQFASTAAGGTSVATYRPYIYTPGYYDVYIWYPQGSNRATNAPWAVVYAGGSTNVAVNQQVNGGGWRLIAAACPFGQGTNGYVTLSNDTGYSGSVVLADAVRFTYVGPIQTSLTLTVTATPGGAVYQYPDQAHYAPDSVVTLVAAPVLGWSFSGWSGGATGTANPLTVTLTTNLSITGSFVSTVSDLIVDNPQAALSGPWTASTATDDYGAGYQYASTVSGSASAVATFTPTIVIVGNYDVYVWYPTLSANRRSGAAPYLVSYNGGSTNVIVSQQSGQGVWQLVAAARSFPVGTSGFVRLSNNTGENNRRVAADAVRWVFSASQDSPPVIIAQPQSQSGDVGATATFTSLAAGTAPLSYQWRFNGTDISDATDSAYVRSNIQAGDAGTYSVIVANNLGSVISSNALLTVQQCLLKWAGGNGSWDFVSTGLWQDNRSVASTYHDGCQVLLDDGASVSAPAITLDTIVAPNSVTNISSKNYTISGSGRISGTGGLTKLGTGTLTLGTANDYTGYTSIGAGTLALTGSGALAGSPTIMVASGASFDVSTVAGGFHLASGQTLAGIGTTLGPVTIDSGATLTPGAGAALGTLTISNSLALGGSADLRISKSGSTLSSDQVTGISALIRGGALNVSLVPGSDPLAGGDTFPLFSAASSSGLFAATNLPSVGASTNWWTTDNYETIILNVWPHAGEISYTRPSGMSLKMEIADVLTNVTGAITGKTIQLAGVGTSTNGATIMTNGTYIFYIPAAGNNNDEYFTYTASDGRGGSASANIHVSVTQWAGATQAITVTNNTVTLNLAGIPGYEYAVKRSADLVEWVTLVTTSAPPAGVFQWVDDFSDLGGPPASAYYRLAQP